MNYYVYILYSKKIDKYYVGYSVDPINRLTYHNSNGNKIWSKRGQPWKLMTTLIQKDKASALKSEKKIKRMKSRAYIEDLINRNNSG